MSFWQSFGVALLAGFLAAIVAPLVTASLALRNWRTQKRFELKYDILRGAIGALAAWSSDALDIDLQKNKSDVDGTARAVEMRPATAQALGQYRGLVGAFFSEAVWQKFDVATRAKISIQNSPNDEFEAARREFIEAASAELGLRNG